MRLCRFLLDGKPTAGFFRENSVLPLSVAAEAQGIDLPASDCLLPFLPGGAARAAVTDLQQRLSQLMDEELFSASIDLDRVEMLVPVERPSKLLLLAGNYSKHIEEGGGRAEERSRTFPYLFMKPPQTTLTNPGGPIVIPSVSPDHIDWELELAIVIGRECRHVSEQEAGDYIAGFTIINDISDRKFRPNPDRAQRERDGFFDWLHGKWHDTFCPMGPCILPADEVADPQALAMQLKVNGEVEQSASTAEMVFPVAAVVEFVSQIVTLVPGDVISTGTPAGVGSAKGKFLKPGDQIEASIEQIGTLQNSVVSAET